MHFSVQVPLLSVTQVRTFLQNWSFPRGISRFPFSSSQILSFIRNNERLLISYISKNTFTFLNDWRFVPKLHHLTKNSSAINLEKIVCLYKSLFEELRETYLHENCINGSSLQREGVVESVVTLGASGVLSSYKLCFKLSTSVYLTPYRLTIFISQHCRII